jgi:prepilin-type N-terminal cleavage/methylation domain-containing protein
MKASKKEFASSLRSRKSAGFSLIELMIVVAVILIIAGTAIPNFIRSKMRANESGAVANLRNITTADVVYNITYGIGFSQTLGYLGGNAALASSTQAGLIDSVLSSGVKSGYIYTYTPLSPDTNTPPHYQGYSITADPITPGTTGERHFYTDQSAVIRQNLTATAGPSDPPIN